MEPGGLAVGIVGLAGLFNNALDCFEYVQLGRSFGTDFQTSLLKLDHARLRLSRWGEAVGLSGDLRNARSLQSAAIKREDMDTAEKVLGHIQNLFDNAEKRSARYKLSKRSDDPDLAILEVQADMDPVGRSLHENMRKLCIKRQNKTTLSQKAKWALYEEKYLRGLIEDIKELVNSLPDFLPTVKQEQRKLCEAEVREIGRESLPVLSHVIQSQDDNLDAAISAAMGTAGATFHNHNSRIGAQGSSVTINGGINF